MSTPKIIALSSRDNPLFKDLRRLAQDNNAYRKLGRLWLAGDHLCRACLDHGQRPALALFAESTLPQALTGWALDGVRICSLPDELMAEIGGLESPAQMGFMLDLPAPLALQTGLPSVILDRLQDAGNVGSILRSAAAFGFTQVIAIKGTAALWGPKVLRAGMGAHFGLRLIEGALLVDVAALTVPIIATSSHLGVPLHQTRLPHPCAWALGHEGQGVSAELAEQAALSVRIAQPGGEESLNVAAAAAICLHASATSSSR
jgi:TrmH family RNA methyltransferase